MDGRKKYKKHKKHRSFEAPLFTDFGAETDDENQPVYDIIDKEITNNQTEKIIPPSIEKLPSDENTSTIDIGSISECEIETESNVALSQNSGSDTNLSVASIHSDVFSVDACSISGSITDSLNSISAKSDNRELTKIIDTFSTTWNKIITKDVTPILTNVMYKTRRTAKKINPEDLIEILEVLKKKWIIPEWRALSIPSIMLIGLKNFNLSYNCLDVEKIIEETKKAYYEIGTLLYAFKIKKLISLVSGDEYKMAFSKIFEIIYYSSAAIQTSIRGVVAMNPNYDSSMNDDETFTKYSSLNVPSKNHGYLIMYLLDKCAELQYRKYKGLCYSRIYTDDEQHYFTYAWKGEMEIKDFVTKESIKKEINFEQWEYAMEKDNASKAIKYLTDWEDMQFPSLKKNRNVLSFKNGVYFTIFPPLKNGKLTDQHINGQYTDYFYKYGTYPAPRDDIVASKYFDYDFVNYTTNKDDPNGVYVKDWYDIPTPNMQKILDYQLIGEKDYKEICKWVYIMIGRILYSIKTIDKWETILFFKGQAGTGKSTISSSIVSQFYEDVDIASMDDTIEEQFGLSKIYDKFIFLATDISNKFRISQMDFQKMLSGEKLSICIKGKTAVDTIWSVPGIMAGNEDPGFYDNGGCIGRRMLYVAFRKKVAKNDVDNSLEDKLKIEIPHIIKKCNMAYLDACNKYGREAGIWACVPKYFDQNREELTEQSNPLLSFLLSPNVIYSNDLFCPETDFQLAYKNYNYNNNLKSKKWTVDLYTGPFADMAVKYNVDIKIERKQLHHPSFPKNKKKTLRWIFGLDIVREEVDEDVD